MQFAFANEVARVCDAYDVNAHEVISSGKLGYKRTNVALPGLVGGPCLEKDPHILTQSARERGLESRYLGGPIGQPTSARRNGTVHCRSDVKRNLSHPRRIRVLGMAFKGVPATDDLRGSMSVKVSDALKKARPDSEVGLLDPVIEPRQWRLTSPTSTLRPYRRCGKRRHGGHHRQ